MQTEKEQQERTNKRTTRTKSREEVNNELSRSFFRFGAVVVVRGVHSILLHISCVFVSFLFFFASPHLICHPAPLAAPLFLQLQIKQPETNKTKKKQKQTREEKE